MVARSYYVVMRVLFSVVSACCFRGFEVVAMLLLWYFGMLLRCC